jgi:hypothetical protein
MTGMPDTIHTGIAEIGARLRSVRAEETRVRLLHGLVQTALCALALVILLTVAEAVLHGSAATRTIFAAGFVACVTGAFLYFAGRPLAEFLHLVRGETDEQTADRVGAAFPEIKDRLLNLFQLLRARETSKDYYSLDLIDAAFADLAGTLRPRDFSVMIDRTALRASARFLPVALVACILLIVLLPGTLGGAAQRILFFNRDFVPPPEYVITVTPGNAEIVKGARVEILARVEGTLHHPVRFLIRPEGQESATAQPVQASADGAFRFTLDNIRLSTHYAVGAGPVETGEYMLRILDRPIVNMLRLHVSAPAYAGIPPRWLDDNVGDLTALPGTQVRFALEASTTLATAALVFADSTTVPLRVDGKSASGAITLKKAGTYHVRVTTPQNVSNLDPIEYALRLVTDAYPAIAILSPGANIDVAGDETLPMLFRLTDDYGLSKLRLAYKLIHSKYEQAAADFTYVEIPLTGSGPERLIPWNWLLSTLRLAPEDAIEYHAEAFDNDMVSGPKMAVSDSYILRLPSIDEVFADVDKTHEESHETLQEALRQAEEAKKELEDLARDMKKPQERLSWEDKKKAEDVAKRYEEVQKKLEQVQQAMDRMMNEMKKNNTVSPETLEKYQELQQLMEQMNSPEFAEAMKKLQDAMQQMTPDAMKQALQQFSFNEEQFRKSIERTMNLLKRIQIEQKMGEAVKRAEAMQKAQEDLQKQTAEQKQDKPQDAAEAAKRQEDLAKQYERMREELKELQKKMEEFPSEMPLEEMQKMQEGMDRNDLEKMMEQSAQSLRQQQMQQAMAQQQQASRMMSQMAQDLKQMQQQMSKNQQKQIVNEMRRAAKDLLELSRRQEALKNATRGLDPGSQQFRENAQQQAELMSDLSNVTSRLSGLSQKTFSISPEMGKSIGEAIRKMSDAMQSLDQRNGTGASQQQGGAMAALNETAQQLQSAAQGMSQGGGQGMGMAGFMQRLQQMGGQQQGINDQTKGLSPQQAAEMGRLAAEQGAVRKSLEDLAREAARSGELSKLLGDLQRVARDMREVQTDLANGAVNPETRTKQDRILSRLLDAQRSMHERDFEKRRKAESGTARARPSPPTIDLSTVEGRNRLQRDLMRALEEGYARDYEELIRKYFEALQQ